MYQFKIKKQEYGGYKFELDGIIMLVGEYTMNDDKHFLKNPDKAFAYFYIGDNIYGLSNEPKNYDTAEAFYDAINLQYGIFKTDDQIGTGSKKILINNGGGLNDLKQSA